MNGIKEEGGDASDKFVEESKTMYGRKCSKMEWILRKFLSPESTTIVTLIIGFVFHNADLGTDILYVLTVPKYSDAFNTWMVIAILLPFAI